MPMMRVLIVTTLFGAVFGSLYGEERLNGEVVVKVGDGSFSMRGIQAFGRGVPEFRAKAFNGLQHDWEYPVFGVTYVGHDKDDESKTIRKTFTVEGMCVWPKGHECTIVQSLDFGFFVGSPGTPLKVATPV